jgi:hypothetical protein
MKRKTGEIRTFKRMELNGFSTGVANAAKISDTRWISIVEKMNTPKPLNSVNAKPFWAIL